MCKFSVRPGSTDSIEKIANVPVKLVLREVVTVEKKKKLETLHQDIGTCDVSLRPLLDGSTSFRTTANLYPSAEMTPTDGAVRVPAAVDVEVTIEHPLMNPAQCSSSNFLTLSATVYSIPDSPNFACDSAGVVFQGALQLPYKVAGSPTNGDGADHEGNCLKAALNHGAVASAEAMEGAVSWGWC